MFVHLCVNVGSFECLCTCRDSGVHLCSLRRVREFKCVCTGVCSAGVCARVCVHGCCVCGCVCVCVWLHVRKRPMTLNGAETLLKAVPPPIIILLISLAERLR